MIRTDPCRQYQERQVFELSEHLVKDLIAYRQITRFSKQEHAGAGNQKPAISNQLLGRVV